MWGTITARFLKEASSPDSSHYHQRLHDPAAVDDYHGQPSNCSEARQQRSPTWMRESSCAGGAPASHLFSGVLLQYCPPLLPVVDSIDATGNFGCCLRSQRFKSASLIGDWGCWFYNV